jgi:hypothetical protein
MSDDLIQLRNAIDTLLELPENIRGVLAALIAPKASGNGHDEHPPAYHPPQRRRRLQTKPSASVVKENETELIDAMRERPDATFAQLAEATDSPQATVNERVKRLRQRGEVSKDDRGRWVVEDPARSHPTKPAVPPAS